MCGFCCTFSLLLLFNYFPLRQKRTRKKIIKKILPAVLLQLINEHPEFKEVLTRILMEKGHKSLETEKNVKKN